MLRQIVKTRQKDKRQKDKRQKDKRQKTKREKTKRQKTKREWEIFESGRSSSFSMKVILNTEY